MRAHQLVVDHEAHVVEAQLFDLGDLVRSAEAIEEMQERNARLQGRGVRDQRHVHGFLHRIGRQQRKAGRPDRHGVLMIAKDRQRLRRNGAGSHVNDRRGQLARDLVHVGNHQQQALR